MLRYLKYPQPYLKHCVKSFLSANYSTKRSRMKSLRAALLQLDVGTEQHINLDNAAAEISKAAKAGAQLIALPECFNSPYGTAFFDKYAEIIPDGPTCEMLSKAAQDNGVYLVGGTIPERDENELFNTCTVWNPDGELIARYRKMHLFDIDIPGGITFKESEVLSAGKELTTFSMNDDLKIGIGVCYDLRFEELAKLYRLKGCKILIYPGAFNMTTGPIHWELLQRARALDNQCFVFAISPARSEKGYIAWGHSQVTSPWGKIIKQAGYKQEAVICDIDLKQCTEIREQIPIYEHRRCDIYDTILCKKC